MICNRISLAALVVGCTVLLGGCAEVDEVHVLRVTGTVKFNDGSIPQGEIANVLFTPKELGVKLKAATGAILPDGKFEMSTMRPGDGVIPGEYYVIFEVHKTYVGRESLVNAKFTNPTTTPYIVKVVEGEKNVFDFVIEKAP